jgi:enamine deaminase RidA (YjgF/YER057c/UK114 family)
VDVNKITRTEDNGIASTSVQFGDFVFVAGMTAKDLTADVKGQTEQVLARVDAALATCSADKSCILQAQIWLKDIRDRDAMNTVWTAWLPASSSPARACVEANMASPRHLVEIMVIACRKGQVS